ncbi:hypothetical protein C2G38_2222348 [Gigaspora rosea]|uniref:Uncharacterized protein n=1 Tax=Gigaspora rosea TaxID=44941 RepID=A0A397U5X1_9GLOM|nr:hypothetical protein C2G38_2222348 [Gigaspora rosea]
MWEISSCYPPFKDDVEQHQLALLILDIKDGVRESPIEGTPPAYVKIYTDCWQYDPESRPDIQQNFLNLLEVLSINNEQAINRNAYDTDVLEDHESSQKFDQNSLVLSMFISDSTHAILMQNATSLLAHDKTDKYKKRLVDFDKSLKIEPNNADALKGRREIYSMMKRYEESLTDLNKSLEIEPNNALA